MAGVYISCQDVSGQWLLIGMSMFYVLILN